MMTGIHDGMNFSNVWRELSGAMRQTGRCAVDFNRLLKDSGEPVPDDFTSLESWTVDTVNNTLVVSINGGVKTGKSTLFNILCGARLSPVTNRITTRHPLAAVPHTLDPPDLTPRDLLPPSQPIIESETVPEAVCDPAATEAVYVVRYDSDLGCCMLIDCPDYNSVELRNRERAREIARASDIILLVLTTESTFDERTADFFVDVHGRDKLIVPVIGSQKGEADPRALIDGFKESLKRHKGIEWSPDDAIHIGMLDPGDLSNPSPASCKPVAGFGTVDLSQADYRARVKVNVWKRTAHAKLVTSIAELEARQTDIRKSVDTANKLAVMTGQSADAILRSSFPLGLLTGIVWQEIMRSCDPITRRLLRYQTRFGIHLRRQAARITDSLNALRQRPPEVNRQDAETRQIKRFNDILAEWQKKRAACLAQAGFSPPEPPQTPAAKTLMRYFEENYGDHAKQSLFEQEVRDHAREWLKHTRRRRTVRFALLMVSSAVPLVIIVLALLPGFLATEFILAAFLSPAVVEALRNVLLPVIDPVEKAWITREKPAIIRILNAIPPDDAARRLGMATQMANCLATFKQTAETALANVKRINPVPAPHATSGTRNGGDGR